MSNVDKLNNCSSFVKRIIKSALHCRALIAVILAALVLIPSPGSSAAGPQKSVIDAAVDLVQFCNDPKVGFNEQDIALLVEYVLTSKPERDYALPESSGCSGAYQEFDSKVSFPRFMEYSYSSHIPASVTRPSSLRFSIWSGPRGGTSKLPSTWKPVPQAGSPFVLHGFQHDSNTPDLTTGVYYEYDLKRTLIQANYKGRQVLISISKQIDKSNVGKKGFILGNDSDWNYYYSNEPGSAKTGLGWVKSYIYDYFSVGIYVESNASPIMVRTGVFQWISGGWSGINFIQSSHIIEGMKRFARNNKLILESLHLPAMNRITSIYKGLLNMPAGDLTKLYVSLQQAQQTAAVRIGKYSKSKADDPLSYAKKSKDQMVEELMLEYLKMALGKATPMDKQFSLLAQMPLI